MALFYRRRRRKRRRRIKGVNEFFDLILMLNNEWLGVSCVCECVRVYQWVFTYLERVEEN